MLATGFSPRKAALSIYVIRAMLEMDDLPRTSGRHRMGKACSLCDGKLAE